MAIFNPSDYRVPAFTANPDRKLSWFKEAKQDGLNFLSTQRSSVDIERTIDVLAGMDDKPIPDSLSSLYVNFTKRQAREMVATLSNLRPIWGYSTKNEEFDQQAFVLNHLFLHWYNSTFADRSIREALQWALTSCGYISPIWQPQFWPDGYGDIALKTYGPKSVIPVQLPADGDLQQAYAIIIHIEVPISQAHRMWPHFQDLIKPDRHASGTYSKRFRSNLPRFLSPVFNAVWKEKDEQPISGPIVDIYNTYIMDQSLNNSLKPIQMGQPGTSWHYQVEPNGKLFPLRRHMVCTNNHILYDNTSEYWHGKAPIVKLAIDDWPWEFQGYSVIKDVQSIQNSINKLLRGIDDWAEKKVRPDVEYDENVVDKTYMDKYDPRKGGNKIPKRYGSAAVNMVDSPDIPPWVSQHVQMLRDYLDHMLAIRDMSNLAKAAQIPSAESIDRILEMAGPVVTDISRNLERTLRDLAEMIKCNFYQFYSLQRRVKVLGQNGFIEEDFVPISKQRGILKQLQGKIDGQFMNFTPDMLIPPSLTDDGQGLERLLPVDLERVRRAKDTCIFHITPGSLHQITQMTEKLMIVQLWRDGRFPIDPQTVAEKVGLDNFGSLEGDPVTVLERWEAWQKKMLAVQMEAQAAMMQSQAAAQMQGQMQGVTDAISAGVNGQGGQAREGRPPSGNAPPHVETKDQGTRSTIAES